MSAHHYRVWSVELRSKIRATLRLFVVQPSSVREAELSPMIAMVSDVWVEDIVLSPEPLTWHSVLQAHLSAALMAGRHGGQWVPYVAPMAALEGYRMPGTYLVQDPR